MSRFKVLVSVVPLIVAATLVRVELLPDPRPCIAVGDHSLQIGSMPWHADLHVSFADNPANATVRVQVADFAVIDNVDSATDNACEVNSATQSISAGDPADYRIFVKSRTVTARDAPALIVGIRGGHPHLAASL
ncbi:MAG: hypothetical protein KGK01_04510 [Bradyrhizobium sp.]|uniref:hypothetical protein n=1 Tax=Bradyrhizobium sp. TaxID=376 RepID=UPI001C29C516|nr:hypothetical protein [Bradyrhizobium sp.]MBU6462649.1 hypothetical protein [Pseudomonadota bacterium]MDE2067278.1 hypothetical protein [Bradyrhizobium sp.]MDE2241717.1 hypothetical protein [Bradyrhizobium sp.]MDE2472174.1 hypothetical protein [Bradyrhizobium sp.]